MPTALDSERRPPFSKLVQSPCSADWSYDTGPTTPSSDNPVHWSVANGQKRPGLKMDGRVSILYNSSTTWTSTRNIHDLLPHPISTVTDLLKLNVRRPFVLW